MDDTKSNELSSVPMDNPDFNGKWILKNHDGIDSFLKSEGWSWMMRKLILKIGNNFFIYHDEQKQTISIKSVNNTGHQEFIKNAPLNNTKVNYTDKGGYKIHSTFKWNVSKNEIIEQFTKIKENATQSYTKRRHIDQNGQLIVSITNESGLSFSSIYIKDQTFSIDRLSHILLLTDQLQIVDDIKDDNNKIDLEIMQQQLRQLAEENEKLRKENERLTQKYHSILFDDDEKADDNEGINKQHKIKFEEWLRDTVRLPQYLSAFRNKEYDDVEMIEHLDEDILQNELRLKALHCKLLMAKVDDFKKLRMEFDGFFNANKKYIKYKQKMMKYGILTLDELHNEIQTKYQFCCLLGTKDDDVLDELWQILCSQNNDSEAISRKYPTEGFITDHYI